MTVKLLSSVLAQETAVLTLRRALARDRVHHAYLFDGPDGVGKEMAAFGLAQALVCERRGDNGPKDEACGECRACTRAVPKSVMGGDGKLDGRSLHPDVVAIERALYEPAAIGRRTPETQDISIDQVRTLVLARAAFGPHEGRAKVFVIRRAEEMSVSASNALLKTLEEPGPRTHFILLSSQADALLPTIRSRTLRVRFGALPNDVLVKILCARGIETARASEIARIAGGSARTALTLADPESSAEREQFVERALGAIESRDLGLGLDLAEEAKKEKGQLALRLTALASALAELARDRAGDRERAADLASARYQLVLAASEQLDGNASAQLVVESMMIRMRAL